MATSNNALQAVTRAGFSVVLAVKGENGTYTRIDAEDGDESWPVRVSVDQPFDKSHGNLMVKSNRFDLMAAHNWEVTVEPERGDVIQMDNGRRFVVAEGPSGEAWSWSDGNQTFRRLFCRETKVEE